MNRWSPTTQLFLITLFATTIVWVLRGIRLFSFLPSAVIWVLLLITIGLGLYNSIQWTRH